MSHCARGSPTLPQCSIRGLMGPGKNHGYMFNSIILYMYKSIQVDHGKTYQSPIQIRALFGTAFPYIHHISYVRSAVWSCSGLLQRLPAAGTTNAAVTLVLQPSEAFSQWKIDWIFRKFTNFDWRKAVFLNDAIFQFRHEVLVQEHETPLMNTFFWMPLKVHCNRILGGIKHIFISVIHYKETSMDDFKGLLLVSDGDRGQGWCVMFESAHAQIVRLLVPVRGLPSP